MGHSMANMANRAQVSLAHLASAHILLVIRDQRTRYEIADLLVDAGYRLTMAASPNVADLLMDSSAGFDLLIADHALSGFRGCMLARVAQAACPGLPVLALEDGAGGAGVVDAAARTIRRWPMVRPAMTQ